MNHVRKLVMTGAMIAAGGYAFRSKRRRIRRRSALKTALADIRDGTDPAPIRAPRVGTAAVPDTPLAEDWDIGTGVRGYVWHADAPRGVVLLQHGFGEHARRYVHRYNRLIPRLLDQGLTVYAIDLPGHGLSSGPRAVLDVEDAIRHHRTARRLLRKQSLPVLLFGHSMGGLIVATSVVRDQENVAGVILSSPFLGVNLPGFLPPLALRIAQIAPSLPTVRLPRRKASHLQQARRTYSRDPLCHKGRVPFIVATSLAVTAQRNWPLYPKWTVPTLIFHGTDDQYTNPAFSEAFFETIASPDKTLRLVPGGFHELLDDTEKDQTLHLVLDWMDEHGTGVHTPQQRRPTSSTIHSEKT